MRHLTIIITGILFFIWLLPLGAFIQPKDEEKACNGRRAICLCSHLLAKQIAKQAGKAMMKTAPRAETENGAPASHFYTNAILAAMMNINSVDKISDDTFLYFGPAQEPAAPVPKVILG